MILQENPRQQEFETVAIIYKRLKEKLQVSRFGIWDLVTLEHEI